MKVKSPRSPRKTRKNKAEQISIVDAQALISEILPLLPNSQSDVEVQSVEIPVLWNFDFRKKGVKKVDKHGVEIKPAQLTVYNKKFTNLYKLGTFIYAVNDGVAGQTHLGDRLVVQMNPTRLFEGRVEFARDASRAGGAAQIHKEAQARASAYLDVGGLNYMKACFEFATELGGNSAPTLLVLGEQLDGRDVNCEPYVCRDFVALGDREGNIHQYSVYGQAEKYGISREIEIYHANMAAFENQFIDSNDIEKLTRIYQTSMGRDKALMIHCTDGMDRAGGVAFAYHLLHNWGQIFDCRDRAAILDTIVKAHEHLQQLRGPSFCTASSRRLHGALQLAAIMKAIQQCAEIYDRNVQLSHELADKLYLHQFTLLQEQANAGLSLSPDQAELLLVLTSRLALEEAYFEQFAPELAHPQIDLVRIERLLTSEISQVNEGLACQLLKRFQVIRKSYFENPSADGQLHQLIDLKQDVEMLSLDYKITEICAAMESPGIRKDIEGRLIEIKAADVTKAVKVQKMLALLFGRQSMNQIEKIERLLQESLEMSVENFDSILARFSDLKKNVMRTFSDNNVLEPNINKIKTLYSRLEGIHKELSMAKEAAEALKLAQKTTEIRPSKLGASLSFLSLSPRSSRKEGPKNEPTEVDDNLPRRERSQTLNALKLALTLGAEAKSAEQPSRLGKLGDFFKELSPRSSRRGSMRAEPSSARVSMSEDPVAFPDVDAEDKLVVSTEDAAQFGTFAKEPGLSPRILRPLAESPQAPPPQLSPRTLRHATENSAHSSKAAARRSLAFEDEIAADLDALFSREEFKEPALPTSSPCAK